MGLARGLAGRVLVLSSSARNAGRPVHRVVVKALYRMRCSSRRSSTSRSCAMELGNYIYRWAECLSRNVSLSTLRRLNRGKASSSSSSSSAGVARRRFSSNQSSLLGVSGKARALIEESASSSNSLSKAREGRGVVEDKVSSVSSASFSRFPL